MMDVSKYLISVTAAAILCTVTLTLVKKKDTVGSIIRLIAGLFLTLTAVQPIVNLEIISLERYLDSVQTGAEEAVRTGQALAEEEMEARIIDQVESYILDKAGLLNAQVTVSVTLTDMLPSGVEIKGNVSPYAKAQLSAWIDSQLGIATEAQIWN